MQKGVMSERCSVLKTEISGNIEESLSGIDYRLFGYAECKPHITRFCKAGSFDEEEII